MAIRLMVVAEASSGNEAVEAARRYRPDVVLMDIRMEDGGGIEACRELRDQVPEASVIMLTSYGEEETVFASLSAGAVGYLLKNVGRADILKAVRAAAQGLSLLDQEITRSVINRLRVLEDRVDPRVASLTTGEREVLCLVAKGMTNKEIGDALFVTEDAIRNRLARLFARLSFSHRTEAAAFAVSHKVCPDA